MNVVHPLRESTNGDFNPERVAEQIACECAPMLQTCACPRSAKKRAGRAK